MKKWFFVGGLVGAAGLVLLLGVIATSVFAQDTASSEASQGLLTPEEAKAVVEAAYPGATVTEVEKDDGGLAAYEVELDTGLEVKVDINTGTILNAQTEGFEIEDDDVQEAPEAEGEPGQ